MSYQTIIQFYLSGTGNSWRVSCWAKAYFQSTHHQGMLIPIHRKHEVDWSHVDQDNNLMVLAMPTHGFTAIWGMVKFCLLLPVLQNNVSGICIATRAGWKLGPFFLPGMSGSATFLIGLILWFKGVKVRGLFSVDMPSNWIAAHWGLSPSNVATILRKAQQRTQSFLQVIHQGKAHFFSLNNGYDFLSGIILLPVSLGYLMIGRFALAKIFFSNSSCYGCSLCEKHCPFNAIKMVGTSTLRPFWTYKCENCMRCMGICPSRAIEASHPWMAFLIFFTALPFSTWLVLGLKSFIGDGPWWVNSYFLACVDLLFIYLIIITAYYIYFFLTGFKWVNNLFTLLTPTHYFRRYKEPGLKLSQMQKIETYHP